MASLDDYDEFGNYIGADLDSDDSDNEQPTFAPQASGSGAPAPLDGFDDEDVPMAGQEAGFGEGTLMEIDSGMCSFSRFDSHIVSNSRFIFLLLLSWVTRTTQNPYTMLSSCTKTSSTIRPRQTYTVPM